MPRPETVGMTLVNLKFCETKQYELSKNTYISEQHFLNTSHGAYSVD